MVLTDKRDTPADTGRFAPRAIALLGFGEAGSAIAGGLCAKDGWRDAGPNRTVVAIDTALDEGKRGGAMRTQAEALAVPASAEYTDALSAADLVISVVTGAQARNAAGMALPWLRTGTLYADVNSITGPETRTVADVLAPNRVDFVDVAAMGMFRATGIRTPLLLSGTRAADLAEFAASIEMPARVLSDTVGDASAVKILRSVLLKGIEALSVECLVAARRQGLAEQVLDNLGDIDAMGMGTFVRNLTITHLIHAKRRLEEMDKAAANLEETGVPALMTDATRRNHRRTVAADLDAGEMADLDLDAALAILDGVVRSSRP